MREKVQRLVWRDPHQLFQRREIFTHFSVVEPELCIEGSGTDFGKLSVPFPVLAPTPVPDPNSEPDPNFMEFSSVLK